MKTISRHALKQLLSDAVAISKEAGNTIMEIYQHTDLGIEQKDDKTPVTDADFAAHRLIEQRLQLLHPEYPVLSEESTQIPWLERSGWSIYWLIDPLDGTREFIKRNGEFTVNIALITDHKPVLGVVHAPAQEVTYMGAHGVGAYRLDRDGSRHPIHVRPSANPPVVAGSRSHAGAELRAFLDRLGEYELISMGSALKTCLVAEGRADLYPRLGLTSEWDTAAAQCVLEEAGGQLTDIQGRRLLCNTKDSLLNPFFIAFGDASCRWFDLITAKKNYTGEA